jgi:isoleucyl-tRNA synthetase
MALFEKVDPRLDFPTEERETLAFWKAERIFERSLEERAGKPTFVFYEGPPTANGLPHNGHVLTRVIKDVFPRYKTMRGFRVPRKAGWDTHGLPVEVEVEKELRIHGKAAIEEYGVEPFVKKCIESVFRYTKEWEELTERVGFWVDLEDAYVTYHRSYVESVWWALSKLYEKGLLYQGHKVVWWWAQGGTALSSGEVGLGYKQVDDPSVYVRFPLVDAPGDLAGASLLVWTTTPWTLPSNMYAAVGAKIEYVLVDFAGQKLVVAKRLLESLTKKICDATEIRAVAASELIGLAYEPPFDLYKTEAKTALDVVWRVIAEDFVTLDAGTGIVHIAPAFGEDDHNAHRRIAAKREGLPLFCAVKPDGTFIDELPRYAGRWVKDCDKEIQHDLKDRALLVHAELYKHDYPFCWRADSDPLIQYARPAWYIRTTALIDDAIKNNQTVDWLPEHIKDGRFGDFLANNVDWALSRERYWGTPLPIWLCEKDASHRHAPDSVAAIEALNPHAFDHFHAAKKADPTLSEHLLVHKPWIDQVTFPCPTCGATMRRVPEVIDCWFDSGCMPFAQWGYPRTGKEQFEESFPADFISEAIDQTRGWFYSLLMISSLVFPEAKRPHPFKTCIVLGHVSDKDGKKESKSKGNYTPPDVILDKVRMEFAVLDSADVEPKGGVALIGREDLEGLDLKDGAKIRLYRADAPGGALDVVIQAHKKLRRRVVVLHANDRTALGLLATSKHDVKPVEVPYLPADQRVTIEDPASPAPGADAFRWFFFAASPPWSATRHSLSNVRALQKEFAVKLRNVYSFFVIYASIDGFDPATAKRSATTNELDRWIRSELARTVDAVTKGMDAYDVYGSTQELVAFVDALSNWYVRRSRARFWRGGMDDDKASAYATLYDALVTLTKVTAPFTPFASERMFQNLVVGPTARGGKSWSVHLAEWPAADLAAIDESLSKKIAAVRSLVSLGLQVRTQAKMKVRQPLRAAHVIVATPELLDDSAREMLADELNVLSTHVYGPKESGRFVEYKLKPNFRTLGQRGLGKEAQELKKAMAALSSADAGTFAAKLMETGKETLGGIELERADVEIEFVSKEGFAAAGERVGVVVLETTLDDELREKGFVRELVSLIQARRKHDNLDFVARIRLAIEGSDRVKRIVTESDAFIKAEVLAVEVTTSLTAGPEWMIEDLVVDGEPVKLGMILA